MPHLNKSGILCTVPLANLQFAYKTYGFAANLRFASRTTFGKPLLGFPKALLKFRLLLDFEESVPYEVPVRLATNW